MNDVNLPVKAKDKKKKKVKQRTVTSLIHAEHECLSIRAMVMNHKFHYA